MTIIHDTATTTPQRKSFQNPPSPKATTRRAFLKINTLRFAISAATIIASLNILLIPSSFFQLRDCNEKDGWSLLPLKLGSPSLPSNRVPSSKVEFLRVGYDHQVIDAKHPAAATLNDAFSAAWWAPTSNFLKYEDVEIVSASPEGASFEMFRANDGKVSMTVDWLDLAVEHMSKWWKVIYDNGNGNREELEQSSKRVVDIFQKYVKSRQPITYTTNGESNVGITLDMMEVPQSTLAAIAYMPFSSTIDPKNFTVWSLAATISSLVQFGIGRIVVSGRLIEEKELVVEAFGIVNDHFRHYKQQHKQFDAVNSTEHIVNMPHGSMSIQDTQLSFCLSMNEPTGDKWSPHNIPKAMLKKLRHVLMGDATNDEIECWLGGGTINTPETNSNSKNNGSPIESVAKSRWEYIFLGEPDLLLTTRRSSLAAIGEQLKQGYVLSPHRLQPLPHGSDFSGLIVENNVKHVVPAVEQFKYVHTVDSSTMSCCDTGSFKPFTLLDNSGGFWWMKGFETLKWGNHTSPLQVAHKALLPYPLIRLAQGTQVVWSGSESGRMCIPHMSACVNLGA